MSGSKVKVSGVAHFYTWLFALALILWPLLAPALRARRVDVPLASWRTAAGFVVVTLALFWYAHRRCSSEKLSYWDGLLVVSASMMTGWTYNTVVVVFPALLYTFLASVYFALLADARRAPKEAQERFHRLVYRMYQHRMRQ